MDTAAQAGTETCRHCGDPVGPGAAAAGHAGFCCPGCAAAYDLVNGLGLDRYYERRCLDPEVRPLKPETEPGAVPDYAVHVTTTDSGEASLSLLVEGLHCAACVWLIERLLARQPCVTHARVNMTTRRLTLRWVPETDEAGTDAPDLGARRILDPVLTVGYRLVPYDPETVERDTDRTERTLLRAMAVTGFAAGNVMLFSVAVWFGGDMAAVTRDLMHWLSALIALPAIAYGIRPFARSAVTALRSGRANMDVPITLAVLLAAGMSVWETARGGPHAYFDAAVMLLFFLLIGRFLDSRARGRARSAAERLLALGGAAVTVIDPDGHARSARPHEVPVGATVLVAVGERVGVDGVVAEGVSDLDVSLITGETVPARAGPGDRVFAGTLNLSAPVQVRVDAVGERTLLAEIVRMMEVAEQGRARTVALADRVARLYAPVVHLLALAAFLGWWLAGGLPWQEAVLIAAAVLIITCPCALALAVPVVQVIASGRLLRAGTFLKAATALERLTEADTVVLDKTGTLTVGRPALMTDPGQGWTPDDLRLAAGLAASSRHPLARAVVAACPDAPAVTGVREHPGEGLSLDGPNGPVRLGSAAFCGVDDLGVRDDRDVLPWNGKPIRTPPPALERADGLGQDPTPTLPISWGGSPASVHRSDSSPMQWGRSGGGSGGSLDYGRCVTPVADGTRSPTGDPPSQREAGAGPSLWLRVGSEAPVCFRFTDPLRPDAAEVVAALRARGLTVEMLSGDRPEAVARVAADAGIESWRGGCAPADKLARLQALRDQGRRVLMVGDGLNDAPALAAAHVSASPASAIDISQTAADVVFRGERLAPVVTAIDVARRADRLVRQNLALALLYNAVTVPLALAGLVTPLIAAVAMSTSSLVVTVNAMRLMRSQGAKT